MKGYFVDERWIALADHLPPQQLLVVFHLLARCAADGGFTVTRRALADRLDVGVATVQRAIDAMEASKILMQTAAAGARFHAIASGLRRLEMGEPVTITVLGTDDDDPSSRQDNVKSPSRSRARNRAEHAAERPSEHAAPTTKEGTAERSSEHAAEHESGVRAGESTGDPQPVDGENGTKIASDAALLHDRVADDLTSDLPSETSGSLSSAPVAADPDLNSETPTDEEIGNGAKRSDNGATEKTPASRRVSVRKAQKERALAELDERAVKLADYLQRKILAREPGHQLRTAAPWLEHANRLRWAQELDALAHKRAGGRAAPKAQLDAAYEQLKRVVMYAFTDQDTEPKYRIVIESPKSLAEKCDRVLMRHATLAGAFDNEGVTAPIHAAGSRRLVSAPDR